MVKQSGGWLGYSYQGKIREVLEILYATFKTEDRRESDSFLESWCILVQTDEWMGSQSESVIEDKSLFCDFRMLPEML